MSNGNVGSQNSVIPPLPIGRRINLSVMMFLEFAVWGAWFVPIYAYMTKDGGNLDFEPWQAGVIIGNVALGAIISTMFAGYIADRFVASEKLMAILHLGGAGLLFWMAQIQGEGSFFLMFAVSLAYSLLYNPTLALSNSIAFTHIPDATRDFPSVRVFGTVGWIASAFFIEFGFIPILTNVFAVQGIASTADTNAPLLVAAGISAFLGFYSLFLPHTPPLAKAGEGVPFIKALGLFKNYSFAVFFVVSLIITIVLAFYYTTTSGYLTEEIKIGNIMITMSLGQFVELILLPFLPFFLRRFGMKWVLALGMLAWGVRYALFALGGPEGLSLVYVYLGIALHGLCFDFFFAAGFIHVDNEAPRDIRASGQALFGFLTYGVGMWLGSLLAGAVVNRFKNPDTELTNWSQYWLVPCVGVLISLLVFVVLFHMRKKPEPEAGTDR